MELIAQYETVILVLAILFGMFMTWGIGANDVANAMGTSVGSGAISVRQAIVIAAIFEFLGAFLAGGHVTSTIRKGIINPTLVMDDPSILVLGMLASLLAAALWLLIASTRGWPVSTTHSIVGAIVGFAIAGIGVDSVHWEKIGQIITSWVVSPVLGGALSFVLMISIRRLILNTDAPFERAKKWSPIYVFLAGFVISLVTIFKGLKHLRLELTVPMSFAVAFAFGLLLAGISWPLIRKVRVDPDADHVFQYASVEKVFAPLMLFAAAAMAFAHGSNDVANGIGPLAAVVSIINSGGEVTQKAGLPVWILVLGGVGIVLGLATMGYRVIQTIGTSITALTPSRAYCATLAAAATVVLASRTGMPVSTTHIAVGAVIGVGLARGVGAIDLRVIGGIIVSWVLTLPIGGVLAALIFFTLKGMLS
ncbi:MAG TPA: inorganic phosphate transporter [Phycisphaerales bacterium]|nr:inorganic phosphate transporter [Phycisphaerales bacterium]